jgi:hypothetical protein
MVSLCRPRKSHRRIQWRTNRQQRIISKLQQWVEFGREFRIQFTDSGMEQKKGGPERGCLFCWCEILDWIGEVVL